MEITVARGDAYASILRVKYMLESQYAEICPLKGTVIGMHWNACIDRLKQARKFPGATVEATADCPCCWPRTSAVTRDPGDQSGLRSFAPSFDLANHRL